MNEGVELEDKRESDDEENHQDKAVSKIALTDHDEEEHHEEEEHGELPAGVNLLDELK